MWTALVFLIGLGAVPDTARATHHTEDTVRVLAVHAYSQNYPWTAGQHEGFVARLNRELALPLVIKSEYLDTKRKRLDDDYAWDVAEFLKTKYAGYHPDVIYVSDDDGLRFALSHLVQLFPEAPVFFSGVNDYSVLKKLNKAHVTGVMERKEIGPNLKLISQVPGGIGEIVVVGDGSPTYQVIERELKAELKTTPGLNVRYIVENRLEEIEKALADHKGALVVMTTLGAVRDAEDEVLSLRETIAALVAAAPKALISMEDAYLFDGVLGGYVTSSTAQGAAAAGLMLRYLSGARVTDIQPLTMSPNEYIFDAQILKTLGLQLPPDILARTKLINVGPSLFARHQTLILGALGVLSAALFLTLVMYALTLMAKNRQLTQGSALLAEQGARLEESEEKYRSLFEFSEDPMWLIVGEQFMMANAAAARELGYSGPEELVDIHPSELSPEFQNDGETSFDKAGRLMVMAHEKGFLRFEWMHQRKNGDVFPVEVSLTRIPTDQQNALFCVWRNITEQQETQAQLITAMATSEEANRAKSDFLANMSHELRTPLNAILGFSDLIKGQIFGPLGSDKYVEYAGDICNSSEHLLALVNDILDLSAIESGKQELVRESIAMAEIVDDCAPIIAGSARQKKLRFETSLSADLAPLQADRRAVKQILINLLSNAVKFTLQGGEIELDVKTLNGSHVIRIKDTGIGVAAEKLPDLTNPFVRSESNPLMAQEGTGLGLAIVKSLVDLHDGDLQIESELGRGTTVTVSLPSG